MQPILAISVPVSGMIFLNGRFLGEATPELPLLAPISPFGAVYLEYRPLEAGWAAMARKVVMSSGAPLCDSLPADVYAVEWPDAITEIEFSPPALIGERAQSFSQGELSGRIVRGEQSRIEIGAHAFPFPKDGSVPEVRVLNGCVALTGSTSDGMYLLTLNADRTRQSGFLQADRIELQPDGTILATVLKRDLAGHAIHERWHADASELRLISSELSWGNGAPNPPDSPEEAAHMATDAALLGLFDEANAHLSPALREKHPLEAIRALGTLCVPMKYALPSARPSIGVLEVKTDRCAVVHPLYFRGEKIGERWQITELSAQ